MLELRLKGRPHLLDAVSVRWRQVLQKGTWLLALCRRSCLQTFQRKNLIIHSYEILLRLTLKEAATCHEKLAAWTLRAKQQVKLISKPAGKKVVIIADEASNVAGHYVVNILLQPLDAFNPDECKTIPVNTGFLASANNVSIAQVIIRTLTSANIDCNNVLALVSGNAAYMKNVWLMIYMAYYQTQFMSPAGRMFFRWSKSFMLQVGSSKYESNFLKGT